LCHNGLVSESVVVTDDQCELWTSETGAGEPLILCHGGPGLADYMQPLDPMFADHLRVIRWDQRGCGLSGQVGPYTLRRFLADLSHVGLATSSSPVSMLGHSWGANLALHYALEWPERVRCLIYVSGTGVGHSWKEAWRSNSRSRLRRDVKRQIERLAARQRTVEEDKDLAILQWSADFADRSRAQFFAAQLADRWYPVNYECNAALNAEADEWDEPSLLSRCQNLAVPTLIIHGSCDPRPCSAVDGLYHALPNVRRIILDNTGHVPWLENPEIFQRTVLDFLTATFRDAESVHR